MTATYFENIDLEIEKLLNNASKSVVVCVAWITDPKLYFSLCKLVENGASVRVIMMDDDINNLSLEWSRFVNFGGQLIKVSELHVGGLMHNKFCVIDDKILITGSYNWTKKAAAANIENIIVIDNEVSALDYSEQFNNYWNKFSAEAVSTFSADKFIRRLKLIRENLLLDEPDEVTNQLKKIKTNFVGSTPADVTNLLDKISFNFSNNRYNEIVEIIDLFISNFQAITVYSDPEIPILELEIKAIQSNIELYKQLTLEAENEIQNFQRFRLTIIGDIIRRFLELRSKLSELFSTLTNKTEDKEVAQEHEKEFQSFNESFNEIISKPDIQLSAEDETELKALIRKCSKMIHPDTMPRDDVQLIEQATRLMAQVAVAYKNKDLATLRELYQKIVSGEWMNNQNSLLKNKTKEELLLILMELRAKLNSIIDTYNAYILSDEYKIAIEKEKWNDAVEAEKQRLEAEIKQLEKEVNRYTYQ